MKSASLPLSLPPLPPRGDAVALTEALVRIDSRNPTLVAGAPGESRAADFLARTLESWGMRADVVEAAPGRPNVIASTGEGPRSLILNGHLDVVGTDGMSHAPFEAETRDGLLFGRGSADMKGGVAAMCAAAIRALDEGVPVRVIITAVCDEEYESLGTRAILESGIRADAAIVTEPTSLRIAPAHRGFVWLDIDFQGVAAHGSRYDIGVDAITHAGLVLAELDEMHRESLTMRTHPLLGHASLHASTISGGTGMSTYPDSCRLSVERRTLPGETRDQAVAEIQAACDRVGARTPGFRATISIKTAQDPSDVSPTSAIVRTLAAALEMEKLPATIEGFTAWTDAALFNAAGIPAVCFGPGDIGLAHAAEEYVPVEEIEQATDVLARLVRLWADQ